MEYKMKIKRNFRKNNTDLKYFHDRVLTEAKNICRVTTGKVGNRRRKDTWWWNDKVKLVITKKRDAFNRWRKFNLDQYKKEYKYWKKETKKKVTEAKIKAFNKWNENIKSKNGRNEMFKIAKNMKRDNKDLRGSKYKNANGEIIVKDNELLDRLRNHFEKLLNETSCYYTDEVEKVEGSLPNVTIDEVLGRWRKWKIRVLRGLVVSILNLFLMMMRMGRKSKFRALSVSQVRLADIVVSAVVMSEEVGCWFRLNGSWVECVLIEDDVVWIEN